MKTINQPEFPPAGDPVKESHSLIPRTPDQPLAVAPSGITIEAAFAAASSKSLDKESLAVMKELLAMDAERKFNAAFVKLQSELPVIVAETVIPNRGKYARFEDVMRQIEKPMSANGFSVSFTQEPKENRIHVTCILRHVAGHCERNSYAVRVGGKSDSETQADCKASTTAKRNSLLQALNIVVRQDIFQDEDNDATLGGNPDLFITVDQADELERRCHESNSNIPAFIKFAGATSFATIQASKYDMLDSMLRKKEQAGK